MQKRVWEAFAKALPTSGLPILSLPSYLGRNQRQNFLQYLMRGPMADPSNEDRQQRLREVRGKDS